jgi:serine/threonine-protein kinase
VHILGQACASLAEAHNRGLVHRDIKPANIYLCRQALEYDFVKVLDFGLVKHQAAVAPVVESNVSQVGTVMGTPAYMAPEIALQQEPIDGRSDLYALGCVGYWLLTGTQVFQGDTPNATMFAHIETRPDPPSARTDQPVPEALERLILGCLAKDPDHRPQTAEVLMESLVGTRPVPPWSRARARQWWDAHQEDAGAGGD